MKEKRVVFRLHELLKEHDMSMRELGRLADIDISKLSPLINGKRKRIDIGHLQRIAEALDIDKMDKIITFENVDED